MNPILNTLNARCAGKFDLAMLGESLQLLVEIRRLDARQRLVLQQVISKPISQMTRLERSLAKRKPKSYDPIETRHVGEFLKIMTQALEEFLDRSVYEHPKAIGVCTISSESHSGWANYSRRILYTASTIWFPTCRTCLISQILQIST